MTTPWKRNKIAAIEVMGTEISRYTDSYSIVRRIFHFGVFQPYPLEREGVIMGRMISFFYGVVAHAGFLILLVYLIGFLGNFVVPKSIDSGQVGLVGQGKQFSKA